MSEPVERALAEELGVSVKMIRLYGLRMIVELSEGKQISKKDQHRLFAKGSLKTIRRVFG